MRKNIVLRMAVTAVAFLACHSYALAGTPSINIPAGELTAALETLAKQSGIELVYRPELLRGLQTKGVQGALSSEDAVKKLLEGTALTFQADPSGVLLISDAAATGAEPIQMAQNSLQTAADNNAAASGAPAEERKSGVQEIVVTAQKQQERLQDVPIPVTVLRAQALAENGQLRLQDYYNRVPGLNLSLTSDAGVPRPSIRGITTGGNTSQTVGLVVDEVPYGSTVSGGRPVSVPDIDPGDVERIEVLRGPQGALYGASSMGGLLKYVTIDPSTEAVGGRLETGLTSISHGDDLGYNLRGSINLPLGDTFAVRASGFKVRDAGYIDNLRNGEKDIDSRDSTGGRVTALWRPSEDFSLKLGAMIQSSERQGLGEVDAAQGSGLQQNSLPGTGIYARDSQAFSATLNARLGAVDIVSATGYNVDKLGSRLDNQVLVPIVNSPFVGLTGITGIAQPLTRRSEKFAQEVRAEIPVGARIKWLVGAFYTDENVDATYDYFASDALTGASQFLMLQWPEAVTYQEYAAFTNFTFDITERFDVQVGGRIAENDQTYSAIRSGLIATAFFGANPSIVSEVSSSDRPITYLLAPRFRISPDLMVYARMASGYRPGGPNVGCGSSGIPCEYNPDKTRNYEIGVKGSAVEQKVSFDASVYYIDWTDIQLTNTLAVFSYLANIAGAKSQGAELSAEAALWTGGTVSGWVAWNDAKLTENPPLTSPFTGRRGDRLPFSSPFSASISLDQEFPLGPALTGRLGGTVSFVDDRMSVWAAGTAPRTRYPGYTQLDLRAGLDYDTWILNAFVTNLSDQRGVLRAGVDALRPSLITYIQPRTIGLSLAKTF